MLPCRALKAHTEQASAADASGRRALLLLWSTVAQQQRACATAISSIGLAVGLTVAARTAAAAQGKADAEAAAASERLKVAAQLAAAHARVESLEVIAAEAASAHLAAEAGRDAAEARVAAAEGRAAALETRLAAELGRAAEVERRLRRSADRAEADNEARMVMMVQEKDQEVAAERTVTVAVRQEVRVFWGLIFFCWYVPSALGACRQARWP